VKLFVILLKIAIYLNGIQAKLMLKTEPFVLYSTNLPMLLSHKLSLLLTPLVETYVMMLGIKFSNLLFFLKKKNNNLINIKQIIGMKEQMNVNLLEMVYQILIVNLTVHSLTLQKLFALVFHPLCLQFVNATMFLKAQLVASPNSHLYQTLIATHIVILLEQLAPLMLICKVFVDVLCDELTNLIYYFKKFNFLDFHS